ncbi:MAG: hypothetical protein KAW81_00310 [Dehalococcoidia bacterium]|nr:hypothetical protein [Dehalococcoidia bacterium]
MTQVNTTIYADVQGEKEFRHAIALTKRQLLPPWQLQEVLERYEITAPQAPEVVRFLLGHKYLSPILLQAVPYLKQVFGQSPVYLEVERDLDEGFEELFAVVKVNTGPTEALDLLAQFDQQWFMSAARQARAKLNFTVDTISDESV